MDAWNAFRLYREQRLSDARLPREAQMTARCELESLRRTHAAVLERAALSLARAGNDAVPLPGASTVVIAHPSPRLAERVRQALEGAGMEALECTGNGATALGVVIAEQPDYLVLSDRLATLSGEQLAAQTAWYSPLTTQVVQVEPSRQDAFRQAGCLVLGSRQRPGELAGAVLRRVAVTS